MIRPKVITAPTVEPVSVVELKQHLRLDFEDEDDLLALYLMEAREYFEEHTGLTLHETTLEYFLNRFPCGPLYIPFASPLISIVGVWYKNSAGTETEWTGFVTDTSNEVGSIQPQYGSTYPSYTPYPINSVRVRFKAGIANGSPQTYPKETIRGAIRLLAAGRYQNREAETIPEIPGIEAIALKYGVDTLIDMNKVRWAF